MPEQKKLAVVTGANTGLGFETSLGLAKAGCAVIMACRSEAKANEAIKKVKAKAPNADLSYIQLDLVNRDSIRAFAKTFSERHDQLDILVNNAGVMGPPYTITENNLELQFDANHIGPFYLTHLLMKPLTTSDDSRLVNVSSLAGKLEVADIHFDNLNFEGNYEEGPDMMGLPGMLAYAQSKLANILFTLALKDRLDESGKTLKSIVVHPGVSNTNLSRNMSVMTRLLLPIVARFSSISTPADGAAPSLYGALSPEVQSGDFIGPTGKDERTGKPGKVDFPPQAKDKDLREKLWALSEEILGIKFEV